jgi:hypothetical protein
MLRIYTLTVFGFCSFAVVYFVQNPKVVKERIYLDNPEIVLEDVKQFENVHFRVNLINDTLHPVTIVSTSSSCACSVPEVEKKNLGPSEKVEVKVLFKAGRLQGEVRKRIDFVCSYKDKLLAVPLNITVHIVPNLKIDRESVAFDRNTHRIDFRIESGLIGLDQIVDVASTTDCVKVIKNDTEGSYTAIVEAGVKPTDILGHTIIIRTTEPPSCWPRIPFYFNEEASQIR